MSWGSGEELFWETWDIVRKYIPEDRRSETMQEVINAFQDRDMDAGYLYERLSDYPELVKFLHEEYPEVYDENGNELEDIE